MVYIIVSLLLVMIFGESVLINRYPKVIVFIFGLAYTKLIVNNILH